MSRSPGSPPDAVVRHGSALRALALALLRDRDEAEDAVQETWLRFLQRPPRSGDGAGTWLAAVLRNLVSNRRRDVARREARRRDVARPAAVDPRESASREAALRAVVEAVLALPEPDKSIVMLRYFEDLAPREIAARLGLEPSQVHGRLHRAHAKLRARLERESGAARDGAAMLALLVGVESAGRPLALAGTTGGLLVTLTKTHVALAAASAAAIAWIAWLATSGAPAGAPAGADADAAGIARAAEEPAGAGAEPVDAGREAAEPAPASLAAPPSPGWEPPPYEYELTIHLTDDRDLPAHDSVYVGPAGGSLNQVPATEADGTARLRWKAFTSSMEIDVATGEAGGERVRIPLAAGAHEIACRVAPLYAETSVKRRLLDDIGYGASGATLPAKYLVRGKSVFQVFQDAGGWATFREPSLARPAKSAAPSKSIADTVKGDLTIVTNKRALAREVEVLKKSTRLERASGPSFTLRGRIADAEGRPVAQAPVHVRRVGEIPWQTSHADANGEYAIERLPLGGASSDDGRRPELDYEIRAGGGDLGRASTRITGRDGAVILWEPRLDRGLVLEGRLLGAGGAPLPGWRIEAQGGASPPFCDRTATDEDGRFAIPNVPPGSVSLFGKPLAAGGPAIALAERVSAASGASELTVSSRAGEALGSVQLEITDACGGSRWPTVVLWRSDSRRGASMANQRADQQDPSGPVRFLYTLSDVLPGSYFVEISAPGAEGILIEDVFVTSDATADLGLVELVHGGAIELVGAFASAPSPGNKEQGGLELLFRGTSVELLTGEVSTAWGASWRFREGEYRARPAGGELGPVLRVARDAPLRIDGRGRVAPANGQIR